jgi:predicted transcriptional regulator of viral defense system
VTRKTFEIAKKIFRENHGILRTSEAKKLGINEPTLIQMCNEGLLVKESRGLYRLADLPLLSNPDFVQISILVPSSVICLISALNFYQITTQIPYKIYIALPREAKAPRFEYPPLDIIYLSKKPYSAGIEEHILDGVKVRIYSREKTIADCFKFRKKIGLDISLEALKDYLRQPNRDIQAILYYASINRVERIIYPYLQAVL